MTKKLRILPLPWVAFLCAFVALVMVNLIQYVAYKENQEYQFLETRSCTIAGMDVEGDHGEVRLDCGGEELVTSNDKEYISIINQMLQGQDVTVTCRKRRGTLTEEVDWWCGKTPQEDS